MWEGFRRPTNAVAQIYFFKTKNPEQGQISSLWVNKIVLLFQISYSFVSPILKDKTQFPFFYQMLPTEGVQYPGMVKLLLHFRWTLVGLMAPDTDQGERFMRTMTTLLIKNDFCPVLSQVFSINIRNLVLTLEPFAKWTQVNVFLYGVEISSFQLGIFIVHEMLKYLKKPITGKIWIIAACWDLTWDFMESSISTFQNMRAFFSFLVQTNKMVAFDAFKQFHSSMKYFVGKSFTCSSIKDVWSVKVWRRCREREELELLPRGEMQQILSLDSSFTYNIIWAVGLALHSAYFSRSKRPGRHSGENLDAQRLKAWQVFWCTSHFQTIKREGSGSRCFLSGVNQRLESEGENS